jgi:hypothetical protein
MDALGEGLLEDGSKEVAMRSVPPGLSTFQEDIRAAPKETFSTVSSGLEHEQADRRDKHAQTSEDVAELSKQNRRPAPSQQVKGPIAVALRRATQATRP